jgi:hypothetical protein
LNPWQVLAIALLNSGIIIESVYFWVEKFLDKNYFFFWTKVLDIRYFGQKLIVSGFSGQNRSILENKNQSGTGNQLTPGTKD